MTYLEAAYRVLQATGAPTLATLTLTLLMTFGCTSNPGAIPAPDLGVVTDSHFVVIDLVPNDGAIAAGVQLGDVLLDLTWIPSDARIYLPPDSDIVYQNRDGYITDLAGNPYVDATGRRLTADDMFGAPAPASPLATVPPQQNLSPLSPLPTPSPTVAMPIALATRPGAPVVTRSDAPRAADVIEKDTLPFSAENVMRLKGLISYGVPLKLRVQRDGEVLELTVTPFGPESFPIRPDINPVIPTSVPQDAYYF